MSGRGRCKSCGAEIEWIRTTSGKNMPLDILPIAGGNVEILLNGRGQVVEPDDNTIRSVSHFVTCPDRDEHRRRTR